MGIIRYQFINHEVCPKRCINFYILQDRNQSTFCKASMWCNSAIFYWISIILQPWSSRLMMPSQWMRIQILQHKFLF